MGQACGCADGTVTKLDEITNTPGIQNAASKKYKNWDNDDKSYKSHTED